MLEKQNLISIIVPIYNVENYVEKCILSIINQTYRNLQIVLVDDGSTDRSGKICDDYAKRDSRIQVVHQKNSGLVRARKEGLKRAKGQYIGFVDGDDYIDENMYADMLQDILSSQADFVHSGFCDEGNGEANGWLNCENRVCDIRDTKIQFLRKYIIDQGKESSISYSIWSKLFKKDLIVKCYEKVPDNQSYGEDMLALCMCIMESNYIYMENRTYYHYVYRSNSMTHKKWVDMVINLANLYKCIQCLLEEYNSYNELEDALDRWFQIGIINRISPNKLIHFCIHRYFYPDIYSLQGKRIILYGAGTVGRDYYAQFCQYRQCEIVAWADKNVHIDCNDTIDIIGQEELKNFNYDTLIIAVKSYKMASQIKDELIREGVSKEKIVWFEPKYLS